MRILPRSRRGTWLLAAAVWCAASTGWWYVLPVVPLAVLQFPFESELHGFTPDGDSVLVQRFTVKLDDSAQRQLGYIVQVQELATVQIATGRTLTSQESTDSRFDRYTVSKDRRFWLLGNKGNPTAPLNRFDLTMHASEPQPDLAQALKTSTRYIVSPDGQLIAMPRSSVVDYVDVWDIVANRKRFVVSGLCEPLAFSADCLLLVGRDFAEDNAIRIVELDTLTTKVKAKAAGGHVLERLALSADGSILAGQFDSAATSASHLLCWDMTTMTAIAPDSPAATRDTTGDRIYFNQRWSHNQSYRFSDAYVISAGVFQERHFGDCRSEYLSPDRRRLLAPRDRKPSPLDWVWNLLSRFMPFPRRSELDISVIEIPSGNQIGEFPATKFQASGFGVYVDVRWSADGNRVAVLDSPQSNRWQIWDIPPRKSLPWFAAGAALLALPIGLIARRRVRRCPLLKCSPPELRHRPQKNPPACESSAD